MSIASNRIYNIPIAENIIPTPCFFPSVSSVKTNLMPVDYIELLDSTYPLYLASAYDIANCAPEIRVRITNSLTQSKLRGTVVLLDSGKYESSWKADDSWTSERFHEVLKAGSTAICFCHDNLQPPHTAEAIADDVVRSVLRDQAHSMVTIAPIIHGSRDMLPNVARLVAGQLFPVLLAVPERELGEGILERAQSVRRIRESLDELGFYCPLHLLGTGNPLSIAVYAMAGADSFDGLEWCQTVVDHESGKLFHFHQWDLIKHQTAWGSNSGLPYIQSALMHNLQFYQSFMTKLREALIEGSGQEFLLGLTAAKEAALLMEFINGDK